MSNEHQTAESVKVKTAETIRLDQLVDYQEGSIVSREIIKNKAGTISVFAFDRGQGLSEHTAPFDAMVQIMDGEADIYIGGKKIPAKAGQTVIMPANVSHALQAEKRFKMLLVMVKG